MSLALNLLGLICGGFVMGLAWLLASLIMFVSIIGIPWGRAAFNSAVLREKTTEFEFQHIEHDNRHDG